MTYWIAGILLVVLFLLSFIPTPAHSVTFLDIGQGDSILLQDGNKQVLIDGGQGMAVLQRLGEELPWFDRTIEVVVATHPDRDHLEGLLHVLDRYDVQFVVLPKVTHTSQLQAEWLVRLQAAVTAKQIDYRFAWAGQQLEVGSMKMEILGPTETETAGNKTNNASVLTRVDYGELSLLLTADAEASAERALVNREVAEQLNVDVLKAGHHGSKTSTTPELVAAASPNLVVISVGKDNQFGHPHPTVVERLKPYPTLRTDEAGSVRLLQQKGQWVLQCGRKIPFTFGQKSCMKTDTVTGNL